MNQEQISFNLNSAWNNRRSKLNEAAETAREMLAHSEVIDFKKGIADSNKVLGYCFWRFSDFSNSLEHSMQALNVYRELADLQGEADALNNLGAVYMFHKNHEKRLECNLKCLEIRQKIGDADDISGSINNIGETYLEMGNMSEAEKWFNDCIKYPGATQDSIAWAYHNLGKVYFQRQNFPDAIQMFELSMEISKSIDYKILTTETLLVLCELHKTVLNYDLASTMGNEALKIAEQIGAKEESKRAFLKLSQIAEKQGKTPSALEYFKKYHELHTEIFKDSNIERIKDLEHRYELDAIKKEHEIERLKNVELKNAYDQIGVQKLLIENRNKDIIDSIRYAKRIQKALLVEHESIPHKEIQHFVYFSPKDIVSGDFYWINTTETKIYVAVADCTGHGVPGGFLTMLGVAYLNEILSHNADYSPAQILDLLKDKFSKELKGKELSGDGMDISLCAIHLDESKETRRIEWAGANNPLWFCYPKGFENDSKHLIEIEPDKYPIGSGYDDTFFHNHLIELPKNSTLYMFSDGFMDQFGGENGKKLKRSGFKSLIQRIQYSPISDQNLQLENFFNEWKGENEQIDDVCVMGVRI